MLCRYFFLETEWFEDVKPTSDEVTAKELNDRLTQILLMLNAFLGVSHNDVKLPNIVAKRSQQTCYRHHPISTPKGVTFVSTNITNLRLALSDFGHAQGGGLIGIALRRPLVTAKYTPLNVLLGTYNAVNPVGRDMHCQALAVMSKALGQDVIEYCREQGLKLNKSFIEVLKRKWEEKTRTAEHSNVKLRGHIPCRGEEMDELLFISYCLLVLAYDGSLLDDVAKMWPDVSFNGNDSQYCSDVALFSISEGKKMLKIRNAGLDIAQLVFSLHPDPTLASFPMSIIKRRFLLV
jgi:hypothetical protein